MPICSGLAAISNAKFLPAAITHVRPGMGSGDRRDCFLANFFNVMCENNAYSVTNIHLVIQMNLINGVGAAAPKFATSTRVAISAIRLKMQACVLSSMSLGFLKIHTPFTRGSIHEANIKQTYSKYTCTTFASSCKQGISKTRG